MSIFRLDGDGLILEMNILAPDGLGVTDALFSDFDFAVSGDEVHLLADGGILVGRFAVEEFDHLFQSLWQVRDGIHTPWDTN